METLGRAETRGEPRLGCLGAERRRSQRPPPGRKRELLSPLPTLQPWRGPAPPPRSPGLGHAGNLAPAGRAGVVAALRPAGSPRPGSSSADLEGRPSARRRRLVRPGWGTSFPPVWSAEGKTRGRRRERCTGSTAGPWPRRARRLRPGWAAWSHQPSVAPVAEVTVLGKGMVPFFLPSPGSHPESRVSRSLPTRVGASGLESRNWSWVMAGEGEPQDRSKATPPGTCPQTPALSPHWP